MTGAPLPPGLRPGGAAEIERALEQPVNRDFLPKSQEPALELGAVSSWRDLLAERGIKVHPAADLFPMMSDDELDALGKDIADNTLRHGVTLWTPERWRHGRKGPQELYLLDGRNRLKAQWRSEPDHEQRVEAIDNACYIDPQQGCATLLYEDTDPFAYVISANLHRRHLTREQRRELVERLLKAQPEKSDRQIAATVKASPTTVGTVRAELEETGMVSKLDTRIGGDGVAQPAIKPPKPPSKEAQIRALREQKPVVVRPPAAAPPPTDDVAALQALLLSLRMDPRRIAGIPLDKRISLGRTCLAWLNLTPDDLRAP